MIIKSGTVAMSSERSYNRFEQTRNITLNERADRAIRLDLSEEAKSLLEQTEERKKNRDGEVRLMLKNISTQKTSSAENVPGIEEEEQEEIRLLRKLMEAIRAMNGKKKGWEEIRTNTEYRRNDLITFSLSAAGQSDSEIRSIASMSGIAANSRMWTRTTVTSSFVSEMENTAFCTTGTALTADGRELSFGVTVEMSRAFCAKYETFTQENYVMTDPLIINVGAETAHVTDKKFLFDLDADGKEEEISFAGNGSGFLALDKNGDGKINDGSELFGTKSGDGFADLKKYDKDGNGWIDEADDIYKDLRIWMKDEDGNDRLLDLKSADVGAIYLGSTATEFSLNNSADNSVNGRIKKTGIFLRESGGAGTIQHVDLAV